jgi:hypothetical protein
MSDYFSDRELGAPPRNGTELSPTVWAGIVALVSAMINSGAFGAKYPERCPDGQAVCGGDTEGVGAAVRAHMPGLSWPLEVSRLDETALISGYQPYAPPTLTALDFVEFVWRHAAKPLVGWHHEFYRHHHLTFDIEAGRDEFREQVNTLFARNGLAYEMAADGRVHRLLPAVLGDAMRGPLRPTGDALLDVMLEEARTKFSHVDPLIRREALERLWDSFERIKSLAGDDKKRSMQTIIDQTASEPAIRALLNTEANQLTDIGNAHLIRHHERKQTPVIDVDHVDYLFHRLFALVQLLVRKNAPHRP